MIVHRVTIHFSDPDEDGGRFPCFYAATRAEADAWLVKCDPAFHTYAVFDTLRVDTLRELVDLLNKASAGED